ncbi:hypothetical protein PVAND_002150 [Polypedilum vanderplanki]|uniref:Uncharacterized protein n=1 Tax=Polypedilum vanderplanki TaxID=319348 RepID=A0A9J6BQG4_POLVA|nr:hypothetical protein PVAND_002150 [Polypedilum vanderplanki]
MDFTQYNKINSGPPPSTNCTERHLRNYDSRNFQNTNFMYQPQMSIPSQHHQQQKTIVHQPYAYTLPASTTMSSNYTEQCYSTPLSNASTATPNDVDDFDIEFFQCTPAPKLKSKSVVNPYRPIIDSMRRFNPNQRHAVHERVGDTINHQTYICSHNEENDYCAEESINCVREEMVNKSYKSFTKIISIPNGVKIITEIKKENNCDKPDCIECRKMPKSDDKWTNKQIEVTLNEGDQNECNEIDGSLN